MVSIIILAAGKGTRMHSTLPKILHEVGGKPMVHHVLDTARSLTPKTIALVLSPEIDKAQLCLPEAVKTTVQPKACGTGDAVSCGLTCFDTLDTPILVLYGDTPLLRPETLSPLVKTYHKHQGEKIILCTIEPETPGAYGRVILEKGETVARIVEYKDATPKERSVALCNSGVLVIHGKKLDALLRALDTNNKSGEYYLTDIVEEAARQNSETLAHRGDPDDFKGINTRVELAEAEALLQDRWRNAAMEGGATLQDPKSVFFHHNTRLGQDVFIGPNVVFGPNVIIQDHAKILGNCHIEETSIGEGASVGPFARLRGGTRLEAKASVGNFVETKKTTFGVSAKAKHLAYLGDTIIGQHSNIGAGTITCNYDGVNKYATKIGDNVLVGSNTSLMAPLTIGSGSILGAGSVITKDVPENALSLARAEQITKQNWAQHFKNRKEKT